MWTIVRVSHHFHSLSLLTQGICDDPIVFGDHDYKQYNELLKVMVNEGYVKGLLSEQLAYSKRLPLVSSLDAKFHFMHGRMHSQNL